jgi:hypothetical protein
MAENPVDVVEKVKELLATEVMGYEFTEFYLSMYILDLEDELLKVWEPFVNHSQLFDCYEAAQNIWHGDTNRECSFGMVFTYELSLRVCKKGGRGLNDDTNLATAWATRPFDVGCAILATLGIEFEEKAAVKA